MAILRGEEARQWLAQNPNKMFTDLNSGQVYNAPTQQSGQVSNLSPFMSLIMGISKPFRHGLGIAGEFGGTISDLIKASKGDWGSMGEDAYRDLGGLLLTDEEKEFVKRDPVQAGLKSGAGILSYGLGGGAAKGASAGARMLSAAGKGALASGVGRFGYSEEGKELESTLKGVATGAALGAAFQGLGELGKMKQAGKIKKGKTKPSYTTKELLGQEPGTISSVGGKENADRINEVFEDLTRGDNSWLSPEGEQIKFKTTTPNQRLDTTEQLKSLVADYSDGVAQALPGETSVNNLMEGLTKDTGIKRMNEMLMQGKGGYEWIQPINERVQYVLQNNSTNGTMSVSQLNKAVQQLDDLAQGFSKLETGGTQQINYLRKIRNSIRGDLSTIAPALDYPKEIYNLLSDATKPMERLASQSGRGMRVAGMEVPLTGETLRPIMDAITRGSNVLKSGAGNIPSGAMSALGSLGNTGFIQGGAPIAAMVNIGSQLGKGFQREETAGDTGTGMSSLYGAVGAQQPQYSVYDAFAEAQQMMPGANASQLTTLAKMLLDERQTSGGGKDLDMENINNVQQALGMLDQYSGIAGKLPTATGKVGEFFGSASEGTAYRALISRIRSSVLRQMIGATQTEAEMKNLRESLPQVTDAPAVAKIKLQMLLNSLYSGSMGTRSSSGYSTGGLDEMNTGY